MHHDPIEFEGVYRYASHEMIDQALGAARAHLDDEELADFDVDWMRAFSQHGTSLRVQATLSIDADRFLVAEVLGLLASHAIDGFVEARRGGRPLDVFPASGC